MDKTHLTQAGDGTAETERIRALLLEIDKLRMVAVKAMHNARIWEQTVQMYARTQHTNTRPLTYALPDNLPDALAAAQRDYEELQALRAGVAQEQAS